jgi:predicted DNA-binding mobile mystery protein A
MVTASEQLDKRFIELRAISQGARPPRGWIRAIRESLGMTTAQMASRLGVQQPRVIELEKGEVSGNITVQSLERAASALGCRFVYALVPIKPLTQTLEDRALRVADQKIASVEQTMRLEDQRVDDQEGRKKMIQRLVAELLHRPARLWDEK